MAAILDLAIFGSSSAHKLEIGGLDLQNHEILVFLGQQISGH